MISLRFQMGVREFLNNQQGQDLIEYALIAGFVAAAVATMSQSIAEQFVTVMSRVNSVTVVAGAS